MPHPAYRSSSSAELLANDWPSTLVIDRLISQENTNSRREHIGKCDYIVFRAVNQHGFLGQMQEKKLVSHLEPNLSIYIRAKGAFGSRFRSYSICKMPADDFIRNNHGIDDGKDLPAEYLISLYERISKNEIKMKEDDLDLKQKQSINSNRILGLDSILNIVVRKRGDENNTSDDLMQHMQEQFKEKAQKSESVYYAATDVFILRFMLQACWAPMLAAFTVPFDQSEDDIVISQCLEWLLYAIHVTSAMLMNTHRDGFVTSLAKFTCLYSPADIKQKNIESIKEAWEHILTCVFRFEHLHLLGEGAPPDATFFVVNQNESNKSQSKTKSNILPTLNKKGAGRIHQAAAAMRRGWYDSAGIGGNVSAGMTSEQVNNLVNNLSLLE